MKGTNSCKKVKYRWPEYKQKLFNFLISHRNAIKITLRFNLTQVRMIIIRKAKTKKILVWNPYTLLLRMQIALSTMEISRVLPPKPKNGAIA